jgi:hypothetical protein
MQAQRIERGTTCLSSARLCAALARFQCLRCGHCCEGAGTVRVLAEEVDAMARVLGVDPYEFTSRYARLTANRRDLVLTDREDGACIFLTEDRQCRVQAAKPRQCRDFPWTWNYAGSEEHCAGMQAALRGIDGDAGPVAES